MTQIKTYRDLLIWQKGIALVKAVYQLCEALPQQELFGLQSQMKRAAVLIPANIAEGYGRNYTQNYLKHLRIARGSLTHLIISKELKMIGKQWYENIQGLITEENKMLNAFIKSISKE